MTVANAEQKTLIDPRLIAGYLRDAIFQRRTFYIKIGELSLNASLTEINEKSARDKSSERSLCFSINKDNSPFLSTIIEVDSTLDVSVALDRLLLKFTSKVISLSTHKIILALPITALATFARKNYRFHADYLTPRSCTVLLEQCDGSKCIGSFEVSDVSGEGIGGILELGPEGSVTLSSRITGKLLQQTGSITIDGQVSWIKQINSTEKTFRIGVQNWPAGHDETYQSNNERRTQSRLRAEFLAEVISPLFPKSIAVLQVEDISLQGIKARFLNIADATLFRQNLEALMVSPKLRLEVIQLSKTTITFKILRSTIEEHIKLFNLHCSLGEHDLAIKTPIGTDIAQVYTTSGSLSTPLARTLSKNSNYLLTTNITNSSENLWYLRWLQQSDDGRIKAVILTAPYSDHVWYSGGLAGHLDSELKMDTDFAQRYYRALHGFLGSLGSKEYLFFNWFKVNSWWDGWEHYLQQIKERDDFFRIEGDIVYIRDRTAKRDPNTQELGWQHIQQGSITQIEQILKKIHPQNIQRLFIALGMNPFTFGAPSVFELLLRSGHYFFREFFYLKLSDCTIIVMVSGFPSYAFLNDIINYPFIYTSRLLTTEELDLLSFKIIELCSKCGIEIPAFFLTSAGKSQELRTTSNLQLREIIWTFGPHSLMEYWISK